MAKILDFNGGSNQPDIDASYWRIGDIHVAIDQGFAEFRFDCYKNKAARQAGAVPILTRSFIANGQEFADGMAAETAGTKNLRQIGYELAMSHLSPLFDDAEDDV
jgi:hypothetical protein